VLSSEEKTRCKTVSIIAVELELDWQKLVIIEKCQSDLLKILGIFFSRPISIVVLRVSMQKG